MKSLQNKTKMNLSKIGELRRQKNMTQSRLADYLGTSEKYISAMENGRVETVGITALLRLSEVFGIDIHDLLDYFEVRRE